MISDAYIPSYRCPKCQSVSYNPGDIAHSYCALCRKTVQELRLEPVLVFHAYCSLELNHTDCFTLAALTLAHFALDPEARLVHGWVPSSFEGKYIEHAWCEAPGTATFDDDHTEPICIVIDYTQVDPRAVIMPRDFFYEKTTPRMDPPPKKYSRAEMIFNAIKFGHDGPWPDGKVDASGTP